MRESFEQQQKFRGLFSSKLIGLQFCIAPKRRLGYTKNDAPATIEGELIPNGRKTEVVIMLSPVPSYLFFYFNNLWVVWLGRFIDQEERGVLLYAIALLFVVPYLMLALLSRKSES